MCGIFGWVRTSNGGKGINFNSSTREGMLLTMKRGKDATGFYSPSYGIMKSPVSADSFELPDLSREKFFIGHCRAASVGSAKDPNNAHPFECGDYILVHNGTCRDVKSLPDYEYDGTTDSEILISYIHKFGVKLGIEKSNAQGVLVIHQKSTGKIYFWGNGARTFELCRYRGMLFFASERSFIRSALKMQKAMGIFDDANWYRVDDRELLCMNQRQGKIEITRLGPTKEHRQPVKVYKYGSGFQGYQGYSGFSPASEGSESPTDPDPVKGDATSCGFSTDKWPRPSHAGTGRKITGSLPRRCASMNPPSSGSNFHY